MIYFDNAATTKMSETAFKAYVEASQNNYGNPSSVYSYGRKSKEILTISRKIIADAIGAKTSEIYFTSCGTESDNWAVAQAKMMNIEKIITSQIEHHAILNPIEQLELEGLKASYVTVDLGCRIKTSQLSDLLTGERQFVSIMLQNNETGVIQPIKKLASIVHEYNKSSIFHCDAVQAIGHMRINVNELGIDMLSASAHKFNGPKGVGFLFAREGIGAKPLIRGGGQENTLRSGTENVAGIYSMAKALEENINDILINEDYIRKLEARLLNRLSSENIKYRINGDVDNKAYGIINISFEGIEGEALLYALDAQDIFISTGSACNSTSKKRSYVLKAMGLSDDRIDSSVRISIGRYNTEEEIDRLADSICKYVRLVNSTNQ